VDADARAAGGSLLHAARFTPSNLRLCHNAFGHHAYEPCSERPLSTAPVLASVQRLFAVVQVCARRAVLYLHVLTGVAFGEGSWFQNVILTAATPDSGYAVLGVDALASAGAVSVGTVFSVLAATVHFGFYFADDVVLGGVRGVLRHLRSRPSLDISASDMLMLFAGVLYNTLHDGTYDAKVTAAGGGVCMHLAGAFGDPTLPLGRFGFHACSAAFALHRAALRFAATTLSMVGLSECVCRNTERTRTGELSSRCATRIPDAFRAEFDTFVRMSARASKACEHMLGHIEQELNAIPVALFTHLESAFDALRGVPQQLAAYMHLPVFSELSCASYTSSAESAIMLPRPLAEFRRCAFTQTCAGRCVASFAGFHAAIARHEAEGIAPARPPSTATVRLPVRLWTTPDGWHPIAVQHYGGHVLARCSEWMVVLAASARGSGPDAAARGAQWRVFGYCFAQRTALQFTRELDADVTGLMPPELDFLPLTGAPPGARVALNQAWPTTLPSGGSLRARFVLVVSQVGFANRVLELSVPASGEARAAWLFSARDTYALETCDAVAPAARAVLEEAVGVRADAEVDFDVQNEPHIRQVLWFPRAAGAYAVVARVRAHALVAAARYEVDLAMCVEVAADGSTACRAFPLVEGAAAPAGARPARAVFEALLRSARLFAHAPGNGDASLVLLERGEDGARLREFVPFSDAQAFAAGEAGRLYFNESAGAGLLVVADGFNAVLDTLPAQYDISARGDTFMHSRLYSPVLVDTALDGDARGFHLLLSDTTRQTSVDNWFRVFALQRGAHAQLHVLALGFSAPETVTVSTDCNYMQCEDCRTDELQALCFVAQRCALQRCVGTVINPTNLFCSVGILLRESAMYDGAEEGVLYSMLVEALLTAVREWQGGGAGSRVIYVQSLSNLYTTLMCDIKNVLAALSALLPSFYATMYRLAQPRRSVQRTSAPPARGDARFEIAATLSPRELIEAAGTYFALSQAAYQFLLGLIFNFMHDVEVVTCLVAKFSGVFENYNLRVEFVHNSGQFLFDGGGSPCEMIFREDISFSRGKQTTAQNEAFLMDLIRRGGLAVAERPRFRLSTFDLTDVQDAVGSVVSATIGAARTFLMLRVSYFIKWVVGLIYGIGGVLSQMQAEACAPTVVIGPEVLGCACGDDAYHIPPARAGASLGWCRGVLELTTTDGLRVHVHNPYEYTDLRAKMGLELAIVLHEMQADAARGRERTSAGDVLSKLWVVQMAEAVYNNGLKPGYDAVRDFVPAAAQAAAEAIEQAASDAVDELADPDGAFLQTLGSPSSSVVAALQEVVINQLVRNAADAVLQAAVIGTDALVSVTGIDELLQAEQLRASVSAAIDAAVGVAESTAAAAGDGVMAAAQVLDTGLAAAGDATLAAAGAVGEATGLNDAVDAAALLAEPAVRAATEALVRHVVAQAAQRVRRSEAVLALDDARVKLRERLVEAALGLSERDATAATADDLLTAQLPLLEGALHGAPAASVLMQCRNNYARRRWDPGAFAAMSRDARDAALRAEYDARVGQHAASEAQRERALQCFRAGNASNTVEACTQLVFADLAAHFAYARANEAEAFAGAAADAAKLRAIATLPDACRLYSSATLESVPALRECTTSDHFTSQCERSAATYDTPCATNRVLQYHQGALSVALADSYVVDGGRTTAELHEQARTRHAKIVTCIRTRLHSALSDTAALEAVVADLDIAVYSAEGDALHQMLDCTFLGAAHSTDLLPNEPPPATVERMRYAEPPLGEACEGTHVTDAHTGARELVRTCGSPARVAIVTWFKRQLLANNGEKIRQLLVERLEQLAANMTDVANYGCPDAGTGLVGVEHCTQDAPWPAVVTDTTIRAEDILNLAVVRDGEAQSSANFYTHALTNATVRCKLSVQRGMRVDTFYVEFVRGLRAWLT